MKYNKWTLGLAAIGVVSLASAAQAEEKMNAVQSALSATTISGYIDTSAQWNFGTGNANNPPYKFGGADKADGFNLNVVQLTIAKPLDESEWASGYRADLWFGPDANTLSTLSTAATRNTFDGYHSTGASDFAIRQAYVALRTPIGNGVDWKIGVFDTIIGYESLESGNNPNFTRSYGHTIEPQTHTGLLATYRINDIVSVAAGVADTVGPAINQRAFESPGSDGNKAESFKTYMGSIALTAPDSWGWVAGSTLYGGVVNGYNEDTRGSDIAENTTSWYVGATLATPVTGLKVGAAFDYLDVHNVPSQYDEVWAVGGYASYQATEKLSFHLRGEYMEDHYGFFYDLTDNISFYPDGPLKLTEVTATAQYDLWKNVISRVEFRWDHSASGDKVFGGNTEGDPDRKNAYMLAANIIYKF
jgi:hypothetical protein